jgi:hypothetical protein
MMILDTELVIKRLFIGLGSLIITSGFGIIFYYGSGLISRVNEGEIRTSAIKQDASQLSNKIDRETVIIKDNLATNTKDLRNSINSSSEETKKIDNDLKSQTTNFNRHREEIDKHKLEIKAEINKLKDLNIKLQEELLVKEKEFNDQLKIRDTAIEKNKTEAKIEINNLAESVKVKDKQLTELKIKLDKEIEWRNKNMFRNHIP